MVLSDIFTYMSSLSQNFEDYTDSCVDDLSVLQDEFMKLYEIESYEHWYYDHTLGAFNFKSDDGRNLYFKYVDVGSFSTKANTWNWGWDNSSTPVRVSRALRKVKALGEAKGFEQLTKGLFDGDEYTGWAMTAIAAKQLSAIGAYCAPLDDVLFIYFIFTNELTQDEYDSIQEKYIKCDLHESGRVAFVCQHLLNDNNAGYHEAFDSEPEVDDDDDYQAWCDECEKARLKEGGWNDVSMAVAQIKVVCDECYFVIKERNKKGR